MQVCTSLKTTPAPHHSVFFTGRMPFLPPNQQRQSTKGRDKYLDTNQTAWKALPPTTAKSSNRKMADCPSYY